MPYRRHKETSKRSPLRALSGPVDTVQKKQWGAMRCDERFAATFFFYISSASTLQPVQKSRHGPILFEGMPEPPCSGRAAIGCRGEMHMAATGVNVLRGVVYRSGELTSRNIAPDLSLPQVAVCRI